MDFYLFTLVCLSMISYMEIEMNGYINFRMVDDIGSINFKTNNQQSWIDITTEFQTAAKELELGELLHDDTFGLFEAMSAIEMMDPKMDAGVCNGESSTPKSFEELVEVLTNCLNNLFLSKNVLFFIFF